jgi:hypothetical protein
MNGTANNYMAGSLGIGTTNTGNFNLRVTKNLTGSTLFYNVMSTGTIQSDVTSQAHYFRSGASTANATFTLSNLYHFGAVQDTFGASSTVTSQYGFWVDSTLINATNNYGFFGAIPSGTNRWNLYMSGTASNHVQGNLLLGSTTDGGQKLQVTGDTLLKGSTTSGGAFALTVQNSSGTNMLRVRDEGNILIGQASTSAAPVIYAFSGITGDRSLRIGIQSAGSLTPTPAFNINQESTYNYTSGTGEFTTITANFSPTSGTGTLAGLVLRNTINQTGGANGITRGLYINPTLTSASDWRAIEVSAGGAYINTTSVNSSAILQADSTTKGFLPPRMTAAQKTAIVSPAEGLMIYQTDGTKGLYLYDGSVWRAITMV